MNKKMIVVSAMALSIVGSAFGAAATFTLNESLSGTDIDWTVKESYVGASRDPIEGDTVVIPAGVTANIAAGTPSWGLLTSLKRVVPRKDSVFAITVPETFEGAAILPVPVTEFNLEGADNSGTLVKKGAGALELRSCGEVYKQQSGKIWSHDYDVNLKIESGTLMLSQNIDGISSATNQIVIGRLDMDKDTVLFLPKTKHKFSSRFTTISGDGLITNVAPGNVDIYVNNADGEVFGGIIGGNKVAVYLTGDWVRTNPNNTQGRSTTLYEGTTYSVSKVLGDSGQHIYGSSLVFREDDIVFRYLGANGQSEELTKKFDVESSALTIDGGAWGGLTLNNEWDTKPTSMRKLTFTGSNVQEMVFHGYSYAAKNADGKRTFTDYVIKEGTGTWHFKDRSSNQMGGVFDVRNGTLRFDKIAEAGKLCALGYADSLYNEDTETELDDAHKVDYAIVLGGVNTEGTLEYTGNAEGNCSTRKIAVRSKGRFISDSAKYNLANVYGMDGKSATFTLDGTRTDNIVRSLSDGEEGGSLRVVKDGSGTWTLDGEQSFSGSLEVKQGTLIVNNIPAQAPFRYFRFYIKENAASACVNNTADGYYAEVKDKDEKYNKYYTNAVNLARLHLYDQNGNLAVSNCAMSSEWPMEDVLLPENTVTYTGANLPSVIEVSLANAFIPTNSEDKCSLIRFSKQPTLADKSTWGCFAFRVPDDAPEVYGYDLRVDNGFYPFKNYSGRSIVSWEIHGSADGVNYDKLHEINSFKVWGGAKGTSDNYWAYDQTNAVNFASSHADGKFYAFSKTRSARTAPASDMLGNVSYVSVEPGAVLDVRGDALELDFIKVGAEGMGQLKNVKFAESGRIEFASSPKNEVLIPAGLSDTVNAGNLSKWKVVMDGESCPSGRLSVTDSGIVYRSPGLVISVR